MLRALLPILLATSGTIAPVLTAPPIVGLTSGDLHDTFDQLRGLARHEAIDIMEPRGTPVHAVVNGTIAKLFLSKPGGNTIYLFDEAIDPLGKAAVMKPLIVLDGSPSGVFANHRHNLDAYISEARQKIYSIREELER